MNLMAIYLYMLKVVSTSKELLKFEDIFDVGHFIDYLKDDVQIIRDIPEWFTDKTELFTSIRRTVKNIPKYAPAQFYIDNVLPRVKEKKIMALKPFVDRLGLWWAEQHGTIKEHVSQSLKAICSIFSFSSLKITKEELATKLELDEFRKHVTSLAALDFLVCLKSDVFLMTHGGNFAKLIFGHRRYMGRRLKSIKPDKGIMTESLPLHGLGHIRGRRDHHPPDTNRSTGRNFP